MNMIQHCNQKITATLLTNREMMIEWISNFTIIIIVKSFERFVNKYTVSSFFETFSPTVKQSVIRHFQFDPSQCFNCVIHLFIAIFSS